MIVLGRINSGHLEPLGEVHPAQPGRTYSLKVEPATTQTQKRPSLPADGSVKSASTDCSPGDSACSNETPPGAVALSYLSAEDRDRFSDEGNDPNEEVEW